MSNEVGRFLDSLSASTKLFIAALLLIAVVVGIWTGIIPVDDEGQAILTTIIGSALLFALRQYSASTKARVEENTQITTETAVSLNNLEEITRNYVQQTQLLQASQLENAAYRRVFNRIRSEITCAECAQKVAKEFEDLRAIQ